MAVKENICELLSSQRHRRALLTLVKDVFARHFNVALRSRTDSDGYQAKDVLARWCPLLPMVEVANGRADDLDIRTKTSGPIVFRLGFADSRHREGRFNGAQECTRLGNIAGDPAGDDIGKSRGGADDDPSGKRLLRAKDVECESHERPADGLQRCEAYKGR